MPISIVDILQWRAQNQPNKLAYRFLVDGESEEDVVNYAELDRRVRSIGALLQRSTQPGDRVLLLFPPGLDFIAAYLGCLYAHLIAVPAYPPHPLRIEKSLPNLNRIIADAKPSVALLTRALLEGITAKPSIKTELGGMKLLVTEEEAMEDGSTTWQQPAIKGSEIAFLQYTSGSTTTPKGVMVSHESLLHNLSLIEKSFGVTRETQGVIWLPPYHDMGLIGGILEPLYSGSAVTLMPHLMFLQRPLRWLQAISRFKGTVSGGPNFAYDLCLKKIKPEQRDLLDLSSWEVAFNGAEQVYHKTLDQFAEYFAPSGFRREAFFPCYGLAEATLIVVGGPKLRTPVITHFEHASLEKNKAILSLDESVDTRTLVSCGQNLSEQEVLIVNTETLTSCADGEVGEIWVSGPSVAKGYWHKSVETETTFNARPSNHETGSFMRTGDLGFLKEGELYLTGRIKNLIISDGKNHYSHDIERTMEQSHSAIRPSGCAAFSITQAGGERIVAIAEIDHKRKEHAAEIVRAIRKAISLNHELRAHDIKLIYPGGIPKTTSGKIRHFLCKENYLAGTLTEITPI